MSSSDNINTSPKINYVIATHALNTIRRKNYGGDNYTSTVLRYHLYVLSQNLTSDSNIKQITIVKPDVEDTVGYYNISPYDKILEEKGIKVEHFTVENRGISYTQYVKCFQKYTDFDYYIIVEDDYTVNIKYTDFDKILVNLYNKTFVDNVGFLDSWSPIEGLHGLPHHSAITLGILSKQTIDLMLTNLANIYLDQFQFSQELTTRNIRIIDINSAGFLTKILYWSTGNARIEDYSNNEADDSFYTPIQYYYDNVKYYKKILNTCYEVNNNFKIHNV
jgi:hypothetical protein